MKKFSFALIMVLVGISTQLFALTEEEIYVSEVEIFLKYSLSNNLNEIENAIVSRTKRPIDLDNVAWKLNTDLSKDVKEMMNRHKVNYSMTTYVEGIYRVIIINRKVGNRWFLYSEIYGVMKF